MRPPCRRCGHPAVWHEHHRDGDDCGTCGRWVCPAYQRPRRPPGDWLWTARALLAVWRTRHY